MTELLLFHQPSTKLHRPAVSVFMCATTILYTPLNPCVWVHALIHYTAHHQWHAVARLLGGKGHSEACHPIRDDKISALGQDAAADRSTDRPGSPRAPIS